MYEIWIKMYKLKDWVDEKNTYFYTIFMFLLLFFVDNEIMSV